jgi:hypothetical protein
MLRLLDRDVRLCDGISRREWLALGSLGLLSAVAQSSPSADRSFGRAKACIVLFLTGGPPQHETWDPKPEAPDTIRGDLQPIATSVPGLHVGELMPRTATLAHHLCVLRAMSTYDNAHSASGYWMLTGEPHTPLGVENARPGAPNNAPSLAAIFKHLRPVQGHLPTSIVVPEQIVNNPNLPWPGQDGGYLGRAADPWLLTCDPSAANFEIPALALPGDLPPLRVDSRRSLLEQINRHWKQLEESATPSRYELERSQAFGLLRSPAVRRAFDLDREPASRRDRYGRSKFGQSVLLARRLVEVGVPFVQVNYPREPGDTSSNNPLWDTHQNNTRRLKEVLMPTMDAAYSALLEDLDQRGLLDETLVVWMGEFGRTPRINPNGGRDHWGPVFSAALAGGGVRGGQVIGSSDRVGAFPRDGRVVPQDLHATVLHCLGIPGESLLRDLQGRPVPACKGTVLRQVL